MKPRGTAGPWIALAALVLVTAAAPASTAPPLLRQVAAIPLPGVEGRIDHMVLDAYGQRLFVVALGNHTVEVLDLKAERRVRSLTGFREPQGVGYVASPPRLFVADGGDGSCAMFDGRTLQRLRIIPLGDDADNVRVDPAGRTIHVGCGGGALATLDIATGAVLSRAKLSAHPEAFELEPGGSRIFVNVPESDEVTVLDRAHGTTLDHWKLQGAQANFPMALDATGRRLFLGCRRPAVVLVLDTTTGKRLAAIAIDGDADDLFYDAPSQRLLVSCGAGDLDVLDVPAGRAPRVLDRVATAPGARTSWFDPVSRRWFLAVPQRGGQAAEIRVYQVAGVMHPRKGGP